jgi:DNA-binding MarR family transcriptional regulator
VSVKDFILGDRKPKITSRTAVLLTDAGKKTAEQYLAGGKNFAILSVLQDHHMARTVSDIANETDIDINEVKERVKILARQGQVRLMSEYEV